MVEYVLQFGDHRPLNGKRYNRNQRLALNRWLQPTAYTHREQRYLAGVSPFVGQRALPVTGGG